MTTEAEFGVTSAGGKKCQRSLEGEEAGGRVSSGA